MSNVVSNPLFWLAAGVVTLFVVKSMTDQSAQQRAVDAQDAATVASILPLL